MDLLFSHNINLPRPPKTLNLLDRSYLQVLAADNNEVVARNHLLTPLPPTPEAGTAVPAV